MPNELLKVEELSATYGQVRALDGVDVWGLDADLTTSAEASPPPPAMSSGRSEPNSVHSSSVFRLANVIVRVDEELHETATSRIVVNDQMRGRKILGKMSVAENLRSRFRGRDDIFATCRVLSLEQLVPRWPRSQPCAPFSCDCVYRLLHLGDGPACPRQVGKQVGSRVFFARIPVCEFRPSLDCGQWGPQAVQH